MRRLFTARIRLGLFDPPSQVSCAQIPFSEDDSPAHRELARKVAEEAMVLLKNNGILPLAKNVKTIAVIGPNAVALAAIEGNYNAVPSHPVLPLAGIEAKFGGSNVFYAQGAPYAAELPLPVPDPFFIRLQATRTSVLRANTSTTSALRALLSLHAPMNRLLSTGIQPHLIPD